MPSYTETPEGRELIGLSQYLRGVAGRLKRKPRKRAATRLRAKDLAATPTSTRPPRRMSSARDVIAAPGAYTRRLGSVGAGARSKVLERQETEARRVALGEAIRGGVPPATAGVRQQDALGRSLGRFTPAPGTSQPFGGTLGEYATKQRAWREAMAAGQPAEYPGAYRPSTGEMIGGQERVDLEKQLKARRLAATKGRRAGLLPPELRGRMVTARAQGRPISPMQAQVAEVIGGGGRLTSEQKMAAFGPAGQAMDIAGMQERTKRMEFGPGVQAAALLSSELGATLPKTTQKRLLDMITSQGPAGGARGMAAEGGGLRGGAVEAREAIGERTLEAPEGVADNAAEWERWIKSMPNPPSDEEIEKMGVDRFGEYDWEYRNFPIGPRSPLFGLAPQLIPKSLFVKGPRKIREWLGIGK